MDQGQADAMHKASLQRALGYLNFSEGRPDARFQQCLNEVYAALAEQGASEPWTALHAELRAELQRLKGAGGAFREAAQAKAVLRLVFERLLPDYRLHHADLLFHQSDHILFGPFFLARAFEAVLAQEGPWDEERRVVDTALRHLNDFVGHRPLAILETRPQGEPYAHERVRPIPLYLAGAGVAWGRYRELVTRGLEILSATDPVLLAEGSFDFQRLEELALDPRAYDFTHPVNRRPNYVFGEWDPHHVDGQGHYRRYVARQVTLEALLDRVEHPGALERGEVLAEAAVVFAGTLLMATGTSGSGPGHHDSTTTLATLVPKIAHLRDVFYVRMLETMESQGRHGFRLRQEAAMLRQPFGAVRQHLNAHLARLRALQLQQRHLVLLCAEMGYPDVSREEARRMPAASMRLLSEVLGRLVSGHVLGERGELAAAAALLPEIEDLLKRGINCGALADPWNVLGFQGLFPIFQGREDAVRDLRIHELVGILQRLFSLYARLLSEAAARDETALMKTLQGGMRRLASWWDRFATASVSEVHPVLGSEAVASAEHVAEALARWHQRGAASADLSFWRQYLEGFRSPKAFALVVEALLGKGDHRAAMALLVNWLGQAEQVHLEDGEYSFHALALRWMLGVGLQERVKESEECRVRDEEKSLFSSLLSPHSSLSSAETWTLMRRFIDYLEANAEDFWEVPVLEERDSEERKADEDDLFGAAYEGVTYQDSTDDREEAVADGGPPRQQFDLESESEHLGRRLRFLMTVARLWHIAARRSAGGEAGPDRDETVAHWLTRARHNHRHLLNLLDAVHAVKVPEPVGDFDALVEYDQRRVLKEQLLHTIIGTALETELAVGALSAGQLYEGRATRDEEGGETGSSLVPRRSPLVPRETRQPYAAPWGPLAVRLEQAIQGQDPLAVRAVLPAFLRLFREEALLFTPLSDGGQPRQVLRVRLAQSITRALGALLPRLGLLRETYHVLRTARAMELAHPTQGQGVTEFNGLFQAAYQGVVECVVASSARWETPQDNDGALVHLLDALTPPFLNLWIDHSRTLQLSTLEQLRTEADWEALRDFIRRYGHDLFDARFLTLGNLRGILHQGIGSYLDSLRDHPDPLHPIRLIEDLGRGLAREESVTRLRIILQAIVENYEEYRDFNATTTQSDYGENLYVLLDFLRLKTEYERHAWQFRPLALAHDVLARKGRTKAAVLWEDEFKRLTAATASEHLGRLAALEEEHRIRLGTVSDHVQECFVKPLALDRLCALIEPAMQEARRPGDQASFDNLWRELQPLAATPTGVGLDVPQWLQQLEAEVQRVWATHSAVAVLAEELFRVPQRLIDHEEIQSQMRDWEQPLTE